MDKKKEYKGNQATFNGNAIIAYLDILGFSKNIIEHWYNKENNPLEKLLKLKRQLPIDLPQGIIEWHSEDSYCSYECRISTVSDCIIVSFGIGEDYSLGDCALGTLCVFGSCFRIWSDAIKMGYTLRGSIEYGPVYWDGTEIVGPGFIQAYNLEAEYAKSSRIILGSGINSFIADTFGGAGKVLKDILLTEIILDTDGYLILNPQLINKKNRKELAESVSVLRENAESYFTREKYTNLLNYLNIKKELKLESFSNIAKY